MKTARNTAATKPVNTPSSKTNEHRLWTPLEALFLCLLNIGAFGFLLGQGHYQYVFALLFPTLAISFVIGLAWKLKHWWNNKQQQALAALMLDAREAI